MATFVPNKNFDRVFNSPGGMVGRHLRERGREVERISKGLVGVDSGSLKRSIKASGVRRIPRGLMIEIGSELPYALVHHEGSRPHLISASPGGTLRIGRRGRFVFVDSVRHPGTKPNPYLARALRISMRGLS